MAARSLSPAWLRIPSLVPRSTPWHYVTHLEIMDRRSARRHWRESIMACWDNRCAFCNGQPVDACLTLDHVKPRSRGGQDLTSNVVPACSHCNTAKAASNWRAWYQLQPFYCPVREAEIEAWLRTSDRHVEDWWEIGVGSLEACIHAIEAAA